MEDSHVLLVFIPLLIKGKILKDILVDYKRTVTSTYELLYGFYLVLFHDKQSYESGFYPITVVDRLHSTTVPPSSIRGDLNRQESHYLRFRIIGTETDLMRGLLGKKSDCVYVGFEDKRRIRLLV